MLRIEVNNQVLDLSVDTSLTFSYENPLFLSDKIPAEYTLSFSLPRTVNNSNVLEWGHLINSKTNLSKKIEAVVYFGVYRLSSGCIIVEDAAVNEFTVQFIGAIFPPNIREPLYKHSFGEIDYLRPATKEINKRGYTLINTKSAQKDLDQLFSSSIYHFNFFAPVLAFQDSDKFTLEGSGASQFITHISECYLNYYNDSYMTLYGVREMNRGHLSKFIISLSVNYIIETLIGDKLQGDNPFVTQLDDLFVVCTWHPKYNNKDTSPVFDIDSNLNVSLSYADYMPDIPANEFIIEMLKLTCSSLYIKGNTYFLEHNTSILDSLCTIDWSDKFLDDYSISLEKGAYYNIGFSSEESDSTISDATIIDVESIEQMVLYTIPNISGDALTYFHVSSTNQYFAPVANSELSTDDRPHYDYKLIKQDLGTPKVNSLENEDRSSFDMMINAELVKSELVAIPFQNQPAPGIIVPSGVSLYKLFWCPVIDKVDGRQSKLLLGRTGWNSVYPPDDFRFLSHPTVSHSAYGTTGFKRPGIIDLSFTGEDNFFDAYHLRYKQWIEKDKRIIKGKLLLTALDIYLLDLRKKVNINGVECFVKKIDLTINFDTIDPAEVEFVEC